LKAASHTTAAYPAFTSEDFSFMLQQRPGPYLWLGEGVHWFCAVAELALKP